MVCNITCSEKLDYKSVYRNGDNFVKSLTIHGENGKKIKKKLDRINKNNEIIFFSPNISVIILNGNG